MLAADEQQAKRAAQLQLRADLERQMIEQKQQRAKEAAMWKQQNGDDGLDTLTLGGSSSSSSSKGALRSQFTSSSRAADHLSTVSEGSARQNAWRDRNGSMGGTLAGLGGGIAEPLSAAGELASRQKKYRDELLHQAAEQKALRAAEKRRDMVLGSAEFLPQPLSARQQSQRDGDGGSGGSGGGSGGGVLQPRSPSSVEWATLGGGTDGGGGAPLASLLYTPRTLVDDNRGATPLRGSREDLMQMLRGQIQDLQAEQAQLRATASEKEECYKSIIHAQQQQQQQQQQQHEASVAAYM